MSSKNQSVEAYKRYQMGEAIIELGDAKGTPLNHKECDFLCAAACQKPIESLLPYGRLTKLTSAQVFVAQTIKLYLKQG